MLDLRGRSRIAPILDPIAAGLAKPELTPTMITIMGLLVTLVGAASSRWIGTRWCNSSPASALALDALDGPLARYQGTASIRGAFIDTMSDRFGEVALWAGLTFSLRADETGLMLCVLALAFSLLTPYVRSKAESWGAEGRGGWMGRAERMILMLDRSYACRLRSHGPAFPCCGSSSSCPGLTVAQRIRRTWQQLDDDDQIEES